MSKTIREKVKPLSHREEKDLLDDLKENFRNNLSRPKVREDCFNVPRPCPYVSCRYNTFLEITQDFQNNRWLHFMHGTKNPLKVDPCKSCILDIVDAHNYRSTGEFRPMINEEIGIYVGLCRESVRKCIKSALSQLKTMFRNSEVSYDQALELLEDFNEES